MDDSNKTQTPGGQTQDQQQPPIQNQQPQAGGGGSIVKELEPVRTQQEDVNVSEVVSPSEEEPRIHEELEKMGVKSVSESPKLDDLAKNAGVSHSGESTPAVPTGYAPITMTEDVAHAIALLSKPGAQWVSGNVIGVDGGEDIVG